jgi:hypothetical protein
MLLVELMKVLAVAASGHPSARIDIIPDKTSLFAWYMVVTTK